jgi:ABC-2 type transport system ATP-binding protein
MFSQFNLKITAGERFGLFGPNGAGKTTLMNLMTGLLPINAGSIKLFGKQIKGSDSSVKHLFGFVPQELSFYQELSPAENLEFFGAWAGLNKQEIKARTSELLEILGLQDVRNRQVQTFSGGMKRRVNLAIGVIHRPPILFLDEPTVGVDVQSRFAIINYLKQLNKSGTTLIYTSHQLDEAEGLCSQVALIDRGRIMVNDQMDTLLAKYHQEGLEGLFLDLTGKKYRDS